MIGLSENGNNTHLPAAVWSLHHAIVWMYTRIQVETGADALSLRPRTQFVQTIQFG